MANKILKSAEEEYDARQEPAKVKDPMDEWRQKIDAIEDDALLQEIASYAKSKCEKKDEEYDDNMGREENLDT